MRVITGSAKGIQLISQEGMDVRPTAVKVKEALFSAIQFDGMNRHQVEILVIQEACGGNAQQEQAQKNSNQPAF